MYISDPEKLKEAMENVKTIHSGYLPGSSYVTHTGYQPNPFPTPVPAAQGLVGNQRPILEIFQHVKLGMRVRTNFGVAGSGWGDWIEGTVDKFDRNFSAYQSHIVHLTDIKTECPMDEDNAERLSYYGWNIAPQGNSWFEILGKKKLGSVQEIMDKLGL